MKRASINECGREADIFILRRFTGGRSVLRSKIRRPKRAAAKDCKRSIWSAGEKRPINQKLKRASINECGREADIFILRRFTGRQSVLRSKIRRLKKTAAKAFKRSIWSAGEKQYLLNKVKVIIIIVKLKTQLSHVLQSQNSFFRHTTRAESETFD